MHEGTVNLGIYELKLICIIYNCSISNRAELAKELHINTLMKKNKESQKGFRTMLEVIVQFMVAKAWQQKQSGQHMTTESPKNASKQNQR